MTIYFDMDGTIADLYGVPDWLPKIRAFDVSPYADARSLVRFSTLAYFLNRLQKDGYRIGIITWGSKASTPEYDTATALAKADWLRAHLPSVHWDEFHFSTYGVPKHELADEPDGILFDDNEEVRNSWTGTAYNEKNILNILKGLL